MRLLTGEAGCHQGCLPFLAPIPTAGNFKKHGCVQVKAVDIMREPRKKDVRKEYLTLHQYPTVTSDEVKATSYLKSTQKLEENHSHRYCFTSPSVYRATAALR